MKKDIYCLLVFAGLAFFSCTEEEMPVYADDFRVYFEKFYIDESYPGMATADSTIASFFFYPDGTQEILAPLVVHLSGPELLSDVHFGLKVVPEETTAHPDEYKLEKQYTFRAGSLEKDSLEVTDTLAVKLCRSSRLSTLPEGVKLVVELVPSEKVGLGQTERIRAKIILTTATSKPDWWTEEVTENLLGKYSQEKFRLFLNHADTYSEMSTQLIEKAPDQAIRLVLKFKMWLSGQNPAVTEKDGTLMTVKL